MSIPLDAIDPDQAARRFADELEWHLDIVPPLMDAMITMTIPAIAAHRQDQTRVTGGGYVDNLTILDHLDVTTEGTITAKGAAVDATDLWAMLVDLLGAVHAWIQPDTAPPTLDPRPDADPLTARTLALTAIAWLIDHGEQIRTIHELDDYRDALYALIRRLRARYGVHPHPRRARLRHCATCGERAVALTWADNPNGSPRPIRIARCRTCGQTYTEETAA
ncbi:hypothetical protein [Microbacterium sp. No. 7]|uniref:hypothetical protein n=1 Tax=Microbacterium sp. No. 7 TaxID=1714373 RepID=UPI0006CF6736|nr:hypothetical protein [Microbacterium sp. No. 7]ALJ20392.1 hypothetical protein AOA12_10915 [Microbacterium sp. No. 7]